MDAQPRRRRLANARISSSAILIFALLAIPAAHAQHVSDNAVVAADDAFGLSVGTESVGLYTPDQVRGFSPQNAGNVRIGGLYFDQQTPLSQRVIEGSTIRVGISAVDYPFPAPTGIADFDLRHVGDKATLTLLTGGGPFQTRAIDLDGQFPVPSWHLKVPVGFSRRVTADDDGYASPEVSAAIAPQWNPREGIVVRAFWDLVRELELTRFHGHLNVRYGGAYGGANGSVHAGVQAADGGLGQGRA